MKSVFKLVALWLIVLAAMVPITLGILFYVAADGYFVWTCGLAMASGMAVSMWTRLLYNRWFPLEAPNIEKIVVTRRGKVRRAKLNYLRDLRGKAARIQ